MHQLPEPSQNPGEFLPSPAARKDKRALPASYTDVGYANAPDPSAEPESGGLLEYWRILRRRKGTVILIASLGAIVGFLVTLPQTPIYQVRTSLEIVALNQNFLNIKESNPLNENGSSVDTTDIQTQIKILQSESLIDRVVAKLKSNPAEPPETSRIAPWRKLLNLPDPKPTGAGEQTISYAAKNYKVRAAGQTRIPPCQYR